MGGVRESWVELKQYLEKMGGVYAWEKMRGCIEVNGKEGIEPDGPGRGVGGIYRPIQLYRYDLRLERQCGGS